jgi:predicted NodU family carbamoyl transferase
LYHGSAAALIQGGDIIAAAQEERFSRRRLVDPRSEARYEGHLLVISCKFSIHQQ